MSVQEPEQHLARLKAEQRKDSRNAHASLKALQDDLATLASRIQDSLDRLSHAGKDLQASAEGLTEAATTFNKRQN